MTKHQRRVWFTAAWATLLATCLAVVATRYLSFLNHLENVALDIRMAAFQPLVPQSTDVVIAAITEDTVAQFPYRSPVDRAFLAELIQTLDRKGAKVIAVDVLIDQGTEPTKDEQLRAAMLSTRAPLVFSYSSTPSIVNQAQLSFLNGFVPESMRAAANLATDPFDGAVRWIFPGQTSAGMPLGFAYKVASLYGVTRSPGWPEIAWRPQSDAQTSAFAQYPAHAIGLLPDDWFKDKVVLVGAVLSITDRHRTPLRVVYDDERGLMPGILIQAHAVQQLIEGRESPRWSFPPSTAFTAALALVGVLIGLAGLGVMYTLSAGVLALLGLWLSAVLGYAHGLPMVPLVAPTLAMALALWLTDLAIGRQERRQRQFVQGAFSRYVSPAVVRQLLDHPERLSISGQRQEATFLFTDIAGFTTLSESLESGSLSDLLNEYLDGACQIILRHEGTVDKFIGDAIMAIFNAPVAQVDHAERALRCALELDAYAELFRLTKNAEGIPLGSTRIGIHTGVAVIGNFGSVSRMDFTALGDTVNTAARTEGVNKIVGTRICCTHEVVARAPSINALPIGDVLLKGKHQAVRLYTLMDQHTAASDLPCAYADAFALLERGEPSACDAFEQLHQQYPHHALVNFHHQRLRQGLCTARVVMDDK